MHSYIISRADAVPRYGIAGENEKRPKRTIFADSVMVESNDFGPTYYVNDGNGSQAVMGASEDGKMVSYWLRRGK